MARREAARNATTSHKRRMYRFGTRASIELNTKTVEEALTTSPKIRLVETEETSKRKKGTTAPKLQGKKTPSEKAKRKHDRIEAARRAAINDYKARTKFEGPSWKPETQGGLPGTKRSH